ncbi:MAG: 4a-hydroxytetrahydrobiopterin dehydratase [Dehalococcoidia bacterium]|nr:4a-hydroxytetrahydrobiopterin dehydratase [Dehalococcoidia bacterium]
MAKLTAEQITTGLERIPSWQGDTSGISRGYKFRDFVQAMGFVNRVALVAEKADHHPDIGVSYNRVVLTLVTHSEGGVTDNDINMAETINALD